MGLAGGEDRAGQVNDLYRRYREALQRVRHSVDDPVALREASQEVIRLGAEIDALAEAYTLDLDHEAEARGRPTR